ncbi:MAG: cell wall-binding repeat-containing protein [Firmicutes bacterium]|nr:cell wall-binding repeat-containing protein [Bacillota bacterium]
MVNKLKNRVITAVLAVAMLVTMTPLVALDAYAATGTMYITEAGASQPTAVNMANDANGTGWSYDADEGVLLLDNFNGQGITADTDLNIKIKGDCTIAMPDGSEESYIDGIKTTAGSVTIDAMNGSSDSLTFEAEANPDSYAYFYAIDASYDINLEGGCINFDLTEAAGVDIEYSICGFVGTNGATYIKNNAELNVSVNAPHAMASGILRTVYAQGSGDINIDMNSADDYSTAAVNGWLVTSGTSQISLSHPSNSVKGQLRVGEGSGTITFDGRINLNDRTAARQSYWANGYRFRSGTDNNLYMKEVKVGTRDIVTLCKTDGTVVTNAVLEQVGAANDPLRVNPIASLSLGDMQVGKDINGYYQGPLINLAIVGGKAPYTWTASGLPEGLSLRNTTTGRNGDYTQCITGAPTRTGSAGTARITVTDDNGASVSFNVAYGAIVEAPRYIRVDGTRFDARNNANGEKWKYVAGTNTLTLDGYNGGAIIAEDLDLNIVIRGENTVNLTENTDGLNTYQGIISKTGNITINGTSADTLNLVAEMAANNYSYYRGIDAYGSVYIEGGNVNVNFTEAAGNTDESDAFGLCGSNGKTYVKGSATLNVNIDAPHFSARGILRTLNASTSGDIEINVNGKSDSEAALSGWLTASGSGDITVTGTNGPAISGLIEVSDGAGRIEFNGLVDLGRVADSNYNIDYFMLPAGYKFTTPSDDVIFLPKKISTSMRSDDYVLCKTDGTVVNKSVIENVGENNAPLTFADSDTFDMTGIKQNVQYSGPYLNAGLFGGKGPYTWTAEGLPEGFRLSRNTTGGKDNPGNYITGTATSEMDAGTATITVTDANGTSKSITINYDAIFSGEPVTGIELDKDSATINPGESVDITATVKPANAGNKQVTWSIAGQGANIDTKTATSTGSVATIKSFGPGKNTVIARSFGGFKASAYVFVRERTPEVTVQVTGADSAVLTGLSDSAKYRVSIDGTPVVMIENAYTYSIPDSWKGKTLSIVRIHDENGSEITDCNSEEQRLPIPSTYEQQDISGMTVSGLAASYGYTGEKITPAVTVEGLTAGTDYRVSYSNNVDAGTATVTVTGLGAYKGTITATFEITRKSVADVTISGVGSYTYTGSEITPSGFTIKDGDKTLVKDTDYRVVYRNNINVGIQAEIGIEGIGNYKSQKTFYFEITKKSLSGATVSGLKDSYVYTGSAICPEPTVVLGGKTLVKGVDYTLGYENNDAVGTATVIITGTGNYKGTVQRIFVIEQPVDPITRVAGPTRFDTGLDAARYFMEINKLEAGELKCVIVADGRNYPDALTGSYLASKKNAPIILVGPAVEKKVGDFIEDNLKTGGQVYILGDKSAVSSAFETRVKSLACNASVERLGGATRYDTNIAILKEAGVTTEDILVCAGNGYADSLSASATGKPILLVGKSLTTNQKKFLKSINSSRAYAIGDKSVVSEAVMSTVKSWMGISNYKRFAGATRYQTSKMVAEKFFPSASKVVLAYGQNFPDGLSGGPIAYSLGAPLILVSNTKYSDAQSYCKSKGMQNVVVMGDDSLISDAVAEKMLLIE